jgi:hypothetical protein
MIPGHERVTISPLDRAMREIYSWWVALGYAVLRLTPADRSALPFARECVWRALASPPEVALRHAIVGALSVAGALLASVVGFGGVGIWMVLGTGDDAVLRLIQQAAFALASISIVLGVREAFERRDYARWKAAGRPEEWQPGFGATPKGWDLIAIMVVGCLMWLLAGANFDANR